MSDDGRIRVIVDRRASPDGGEHFHNYVAGQVYAGGTVPPMSADLAAEALREGWGARCDAVPSGDRVDAPCVHPHEAPGPQCLWCGAPYTVRIGRGGPAQRFCSDACRAAFHRGARRWAASELEAGRLDIADLRNA